MHTLKHLVAGALLAGLALTPCARAGDDDTSASTVNLAILDILYERGLIDDATYEELSRLAASEQREQQQTGLLADQLSRMSVPADDASRVILDDSGLSIRSADGETRIDIGGRVQADATVHNKNRVGGARVTDGTELRRARLELKGNFRHDWVWAAEADFADNNLAVKDFWVAARTDSGALVSLGHQKQPFSLAVEMSSNDIPFTERGVDTDLLAPFVDRAIGARVDVSSENSFFAAGLFGESVNRTLVDDEGWGGVARFVHAPILESDEVLHLGVRGAYRVPTSSTKALLIRSESTHMSNLFIVNTGIITGVNSSVVSGVEAAYAKGPLSVIGEWNHVSIDRDGPDATFSGWHVESAYSLTGESRASAYRIASGEFKRLEPASTADGLDATSGGAWEVAARLANIDLEDGAIAGGEETAATVSLNWYPTEYVRFLLGWTRVLQTKGGTAVTQDAEGLDAVTLRGQLTF